MAAAEIINGKEKFMFVKLSVFYNYNKSRSMKQWFTAQDAAPQSAAPLQTRCSLTALHKPPGSVFLSSGTTSRLTFPG